ncbi:hypothetical protein GC163_24570 [bacterium]|nr:hypothetical protein [bacterium]
MGWLMLWIFNAVLEFLAVDRLLTNLGTAFGWFVGNSGIVITTLGIYDLAKLLKIESAQAVAFLVYLMGFGIGTVVSSWKRPSLIIYLGRFLSGEELEVVLLVLRYNRSPEEAAKQLGLDADTFQERLLSAMTKLQRKGDKLIAALRLRAGVKNSSGVVGT